MAEPIATTVSLAALLISAVTAWLTLFRRGSVQMTQPTVIFFGLDGGRPPTRGPKPKVFLRTLLFSPAKRGALVESMYIALANGSVHQNFTVWLYGDSDRLLRGSGLFVPETGVASNHHFLLPENVDNFSFTSGTYEVEVFARVFGEKTARRLFVQRLEITVETAEQLPRYAGVYFDWAADAAAYFPHLEHPIGEPGRAEPLRV